MSLNLNKSAWKRVSLGEVVRHVTDRVDAETSGLQRFLAGEHIPSGSLAISDWGVVGRDPIGPMFYKRFKPGHVLYVSRRTYLRKVAVPEFEGITGEKTFVLETLDSNVLLQEFLPFALSAEHFHSYAIVNSRGSVNPYLNWGELAAYEFDLPPLDMQKRIADLLWAVQNELRSVQLAATASEKVRNMTRSELFKSISAPTVRFNSICSIASQNGVALKKSERAGNVPMVNMGEMFRGEVISQSSEYERVVGPGENFLLAQGDLLFARRSIVFEGAGACCLVPELDEPYTFESSVIRSRVIAGVADPRYALHFFRSDRGRDVMSQIVRRGPVSGIAGSDLRTLELPLPDLATQHRTVSTIESAGAAGPCLSDRIEAASDLRLSLLADIFGGN